MQTKTNNIMTIHTLVIIEGNENTAAHIAGISSYMDLKKAQEALEEDYNDTRNGLLGGDTEDEWDFDPEDFFDEDYLGSTEYRLSDGFGNYTYAEIRTYDM